ncbi:hypothetical protein ACWGIN_27770 [Streptomyces sp. NPDC054861]
MSASIYRVMDSPMCLSEDGSIVWDSGTDTRIPDLSQAPEWLGAAYVGNHILQSAQFRSASVPWYEQPQYKLIKESIEIITLGAGIWEFGHALNQWLSGSGDQEDPALQLLRQLHVEMQKIHDFQLASWVSTREANIAYLSATSTTALRSVAQLHQEIYDSMSSPSGTLDKPFWASKMAIADNDSETAVRTLMDGSYWRRPYSLAAMSTEGDPTPYYTGWMSHIPDRAPVDEFRQVWDHRWALPALLYAISARVAVLKTLTQYEVIPEASRELKGYTAYLGDIFNQMYAGVRALKFNNYSAAQIHELRQRGHVPAFAADINGGNFVGGISLLGYFDRPSTWWWNGPRPGSSEVRAYPPTEAGAKSFVGSVSEGWAHGHICRTLGLPEFLIFISELHALSDPTRRLAFGSWHASAMKAMTDESSRRDALIAASISGIGRDLKNERATRTFDVYEALRAGDGEASDIVAHCADELIRISPRKGKR